MMVGGISCNQEVEQKKEVNESGGVEVEIRHSAGGHWDTSDNFLPLPFNIGKNGQQDVLVLSSRIKEGQKLDVKPIGAIRVTENDSLNTYIISLPVDKKYKSFEVADFDEFSTVHSGAKWIVEQYIVNRQSTYDVRLKSWENENYAIKYLLK